MRELKKKGKKRGGSEWSEKGGKKETERERERRGYYLFICLFYFFLSIYLPCLFFLTLYLEGTVGSVRKGT